MASANIDEAINEDEIIALVKPGSFFQLVEATLLQVTPSPNVESVAMLVTIVIYNATTPYSSTFSKRTAIRLVSKIAARDEMLYPKENSPSLIIIFTLTSSFLSVRVCSGCSGVAGVVRRSTKLTAATWLSPDKSGSYRGFRGTSLQLTCEARRFMSVGGSASGIWPTLARPKEADSSGNLSWGRHLIQTRYRHTRMLGHSACCTASPVGTALTRARPIAAGL